VEIDIPNIRWNCRLYGSSRAESPLSHTAGSSLPPATISRLPISRPSLACSKRKHCLLAQVCDPSIFFARRGRLSFPPCPFVQRRKPAKPKPSWSGYRLLFSSLVALRPLPLCRPIFASHRSSSTSVPAFPLLHDFVCFPLFRPARLSTSLLLRVSYISRGQ